MAAPAATDGALRVVVWPRAARAIAAAALGLAGANLLVVLAAVVVQTDPPVTLRPLAEALAAGSLLPAALARLLARGFRGRAALDGSELVLERRGLRVEVPLASIARVRPWRIPLPGPGLALGLRSGAPLAWTLGLRDPALLLAALAGAGTPGAAGALASAPVVYARARAARRRRWFERPLVKLVLFALLPACVGFYAHQHIAHGGLFGEWNVFGPVAWLCTLGLLWLHAALLLLLFAAAWRAGVEALALAAAWTLPARAALVRRLAEGGAAALYYASVPALLALRFLS
jgi:hypothetical protein